MDEQIAKRAREALRAALPDATQARIAAQLELAPDALSRALNGKRAFSALEIARLADLAAVDVHWLITGELDPKHVTFSARHTYDFGTGARDVPGRELDAPILSDIELDRKSVV